MKISLINPPYLKRFSRQQRSPAVIKSGTLYYPYWLCFAAGVLDREGFSLQFIDAVAEKIEKQECIKKIHSFNPALIIIESSTPSISNDIIFCKLLKNKLKNAVLILTGTHPSVMYPDILINNLFIDAVAIGEYEITLQEVSNKISANKAWHNVDGLAYMANGRVVTTNERQFISNLDDLPFLSRTYKKFLNFDNYYFSLASHPMIMLITGRGCPNRCFFCVYPQTLHGRKYRFRSPENVIDELAFITKDFPEIKQIVFEDDTFTANEGRVQYICELIIRHNIKIKWFANLRVETCFKTLKLMKQAGLKHCAVGFESGSQQLLDKMQKGITLSQSESFKKNCDRLGILVHGCFMVGFPGETKETMEKTFNFAQKLNCDSAQFHPLFVYPGTDAYKWAVSNNYLLTKDFSEWLTEKGYHRCILNLPGLSSEEIMNFCEKAYRKYHLSCGYVLKKIKQSLRYPDQAKRNFISGLNYFTYIATSK